MYRAVRQGAFAFLVTAGSLSMATAAQAAPAQVAAKAPVVTHGIGKLVLWGPMVSCVPWRLVDVGMNGC